MSAQMITANDELHSRILARVAEFTRIVNARKPGFAAPVVYYYTGRKAAGLADFQSHSIGLNLQVLQVREEEMVRDTVPHEVAHLAVAHLYRLKLVKAHEVSSHGRAWKFIMSNWFGIAPERIMILDEEELAEVDFRKQRRFPYVCGCPGLVHQVTTVRRRKMARGTFYRCGHCKQRLTAQQGA
jgi:SprT protein